MSSPHGPFFQKNPDLTRLGFNHDFRRQPVAAMVPLIGPAPIAVFGASASVTENAEFCNRSADTAGK